MLRPARGQMVGATGGRLCDSPGAGRGKEGAREAAYPRGTSFALTPWPPLHIVERGKTSTPNPSRTLAAGW